ncbi:hypothetical protein MMC30_007436 [Trapelia coarctata]|nr:hypothetical protein [Trapelia coarctata]
MASLKKEAEDRKRDGVKGNEKKAGSHAKAKSTDQVVTGKNYVDGSYLEDEVDAWQVGLQESVAPAGKGKGKENAHRDPSVPRRGSKDAGDRSSSAARKGSVDSGNKKGSHTDTKDDRRPRSGTPYGGGRRSGNTLGC